MSAEEATALPFWVQVLAIALAPGLAFIGVAFGAYWQSRAVRSGALREQRRVVYESFLEVSERVHTTFAVQIGYALQHGKHADVTKYVRDLNRVHYPDLLSHVMKVDLIGTGATARAATDVLEFLATAQATVARVLREGYDPETWEKVCSQGIRASRTFRDAAAKDLGVPRSERRRTPRPGHRDDLTALVERELAELADTGGSQESRS